MSQVRFQMVLPAWLKEKVREMADMEGISLAEYVKEAVREKYYREISKAIKNE